MTSAIAKKNRSHELQPDQTHPAREQQHQPTPSGSRQGHARNPIPKPPQDAVRRHQRGAHVHHAPPRRSHIRRSMEPQHQQDSAQDKQDSASNSCDGLVEEDGCCPGNYRCRGLHHLRHDAPQRSR